MQEPDLNGRASRHSDFNRSPPSAFLNCSIDTAPRPEKSGIVLAELKYTGQPSALNFETMTALSMVFTKEDSIDVYLGTTDPADVSACCSRLARSRPTMSCTRRR